MKNRDMVDHYKKTFQEFMIGSRYPIALGIVRGVVETGRTPQETVEKIKAIIQALDEANRMDAQS